MKIRHEAQDTNQNRTVQAPLIVGTPSGDQMQIDNWSLAGLVWPDSAVDAPKTGTLRLLFPFTRARPALPEHPIEPSGPTGSPDFAYSSDP